MVERLRETDLQFDPYRMSILEGGWINALSRGDAEDFFKYVSEGLAVQYHLDKDSSENAADYLTAFIWSNNETERKQNLFDYHKILSEESGFGFDPHLATKIYLEMEKNGHATTSELCRYQSLIYGRKLNGGDLWPIWEARKQVFDKYQAVKNDPKALVKDHNLAWVNLTAGLLDFYSELNNILAGSSERVSQ